MFRGVPMTRLLLGFVLALLMPSQGWGAITHIQSKANSTGTTSAASVAVTLDAVVTSGNAVLIFANGDNQTLTDDKGNAYSVTASYSVNEKLYHLSNITNAPITFTLSVSPNDTFLGIVVHEINAPGGPVVLLQQVKNAQTAPGTGADAVTSTAITPGVDGAYIFGLAVDSSNTRTAPQFTAGTSPNAFTKAAETGTAGVPGELCLESEYFVQTTNASIAATFTFAHATDNTIAFVSAWTVRPPVQSMGWLPMVLP